MLLAILFLVTATLYSSVGFGAGGASGTLASGLVWESLGGAVTFGMSALTSLLGVVLILWVRRHFID